MAKVIVYSKNYCSYCERAKSLLSSKNVPFEEVNIENDPDLMREVMTRSGMRTVPQIFVDDEPIGGYQELAALDRSGKLDDWASGD